MTVKVEAFIDLEESLARELIPRWNKIQARIDPQIAKAIDARNLVKVSSILDSISMSSIYYGKTKKIDVLFQTAIAFGATLATDSQSPEDIDPDAESDALEIVPVAVSQFKLMIDESFAPIRAKYMATSTNLVARLDYEGEAEIEYSTKTETEVTKAKGNIQPINVPSVLNKTGKSIAQGQINIASSLQMSRLSQYGFLNQALATGTTTYRVNEQLDSRTCPVCRRMDGKVFETAPALAKMDTQIRITDPNDLKLLAPFPKKDAASLTELETLSNEQLRAKGFDTPPYHPRCRGLLQVVKVPASAPAPQALDNLTTRPTRVDRRAKPLTEEEIVRYNEINTSGARRVKEKSQYQRMVDDGFPEHEAQTMLRYTSGEYQHINNTLKQRSDFVADTGETYSLEKAEFHERAMNNAISKMPKHTGGAIREVRSRQGASTWEGLLQPGRRLRDDHNGILSTSYEKSGFQRGNGDIDNLIPHGMVGDDGSYVWFEITESKTGAKVGRYSNYDDTEKEVIFPTTAEFEIIDVQRRGNGFKVRMREVDPSEIEFSEYG